MSAIPSRPRTFRDVLLDIEGTTSPIDFVYGTLFPYARARMELFLETEIDQPDLDMVKSEWDRESPESSWSPNAAARYLLKLMDEDRKSTALKAVQGKIWQKGFESGELVGEVFPDVLPAFERWSAANIRISIFSSGSVLSQKLLFGRSSAGDLSTFLTAYFDTTTGPKRESSSYLRIAEQLARPCREVMFFSDVVEELLAAREAGMQTCLMIRPGNKKTEGYEPPATSFEDW